MSARRVNLLVVHPATWRVEDIDGESYMVVNSAISNWKVVIRAGDLRIARDSINAAIGLWREMGVDA